MIINTESLDAIRVAFDASFMRGLEQAESQYGRIAMTVRSTAASNKYGWLGKLPNLRPWIGDRVINGLAEHNYTLENEDFELTVGVGRNDIEDDNLGVYDPIFVEMGESVAAHPDLQCFSLLKDGFNQLCYDGQNFFDTDHPVIDENGQEQSVSNMQAGSGAPWFLLNTSRSVKPIIFQQRKKPEFVAMDNPRDHNVFSKKEFLYGTDCRDKTGFGLWQLAFGSKDDLNQDNYAAAFAAMEGLKGDHGRPLGLKPDLLVVPPSRRQEGLELLNAERNAAGETNVWRGTAELLVVPWLA